MIALLQQWIFLFHVLKRTLFLRADVATNPPDSTRYEIWVSGFLPWFLVSRHARNDRTDFQVRPVSSKNEMPIGIRRPADWEVRPTCWRSTGPRKCPEIPDTLFHPLRTCQTPLNSVTPGWSPNQRDACATVAHGRRRQRVQACRREQTRKLASSLLPDFSRIC